MVAGLQIQTFGGHAINASPYKSAFVIEDDGRIWDTYRATAVETDRPGNFPNHVRVQPDGIRIGINIEFAPGVEATQDNYDQLKQWFDPQNGEQYLVATDGNNVDRRLLCSVEGLVSGVSGATDAVNLFKASLRSTGIWEAQDQSADSANIDTSGDTFALDSAGTARAFPVFTITPNAAKDGEDDYLYRRWVFMANRSEEPLFDPVCPDGYPIDVTDGGLDTEAINGESKLQSNLAGLRFILHAQEQNRWPSPDGELDAATKVWVNLQFQPRKIATLAADIDSDDTSLSVDNPEGFDLDVWPRRANFFFLDDEVVYCAGQRGQFSMSDLVRGFHSTAASHSKGATLYWIEHPYAWLVYGFTTATEADEVEPDDRKPVIDLSASSNSEHVWPGPFFNDDDLRSRAWQREYSDEGISSQHIRLYDDSGVMLFEDLSAEAGKPRYNNAVMNFPVPVKADASTVVLDFDIAATLILQAFVEDEDGNESRLVTEFWSGGNQTAQSYSPGHILRHIRLNARIATICGDLSLDGDGGLSTAPESFDVTDEIIASITVDPRVIIGVSSGFTVDVFLYFHFTLEKETPIDGFLIGTSTGATGILYNGSADKPTNQALAGATFPAGDLSAAILEKEIGLPAGDYWMYFADGDQVATYSVRTEPLQWIGYHALDDDIRALGGGIGEKVLNDEAFTNISSIQALNHNIFNISPVFAVLSRTAEPQSDAPLETGNQLKTDNIDVVLDDTRTPKILVSAEEDLYLLQGRLQNDTLGSYIDVAFPMAVDGEVELDIENRQLIDSETGIVIDFGAAPYDPTNWPYLLPGTNTWSWTEAGVVDTDVAVTWRDKWL